MYNSSVLLVLFLCSFACAQRNANPKCDYKFVKESAVCTNSNSLKEIANEFRSGWKHIKILPFDGNTFSIADVDSGHLIHIEEFDVGDIGSIFISPTGFKQFTSLTRLILSNASIGAIEDGWFAVGNAILDVDLRQNVITGLQRSSFRQLKKLQGINLESNSIASYEENVFQEATSLERINLRNNQLQFVGTFGNLNRLHSLDLAQNAIREIPSNAFGRLPELNILQLEQNVIANIQAGAFSGLNNLRELNLSGNSIRMLSPNMFPGGRLRFLDLCNNGIESIQENTFRDLRTLVHLNLSQNVLSELDATTFFGLTNLRLLLLNDNQLSNVQTHTFSHLQSLVHLNMNANRLQIISGDMFGRHPLQTLQKLFIQNSRVTNIQPNAFVNLPSVDFLSIAHNQLTELDENLFAPLTSLRKLFLNNNKLTELPAKILDDLNNIQEIQLRHNRLTFLPATKSQFPNLQKVTIEGNPWQCACVREIFDFISQRKIEYAAANNPFYTGIRPLCYEPPVTPAAGCVRDINLVKEHMVVEKYFEGLHPKRPGLR